ncbi:hypothetical protein SAMN04488505_1021190 [Chitinophaga rupis]|uniref:Uncharacterized protein n=1 Tax=Chitinophaga rupis TaxID=573321 RepID=A0A1H7TBH9_9BACT|nr:hypothetical protein [Chitinophaga rupis]SEL82038.1 hypothetical protein SAMN04488505_1021190 [Chitinophaga rupis]
MNTRGTIQYLLAIILFFTGVTYTQAQETAGPDYKTIAILPFRIAAPSMDAVSQDSVFCLQVQQAFYNTYLNDKKSWMVTVQDCQVTDSLLYRAGIDFRRSNFMDKSSLAALLKVDAVITGELDRVHTTGHTVGAQLLGTDRIKFSVSKLYVFLFDGKTGDQLWSFNKKIRAEDLIGNNYSLNKDLYQAFTRKFPLVD